MYPNNQYNQQRPQEEDKLRSFMLDMIPTAGGIVGGIGGSFLMPGVGTIGGSVAGSALGEALRQRLAGEETDFGKIAGEGAWGLAGAGVGKGASLALKGTKAVLKGATKGVVKNATKSMLKATPQMMTKAAEAGIDLNGAFAKWAPKLGSNYDEMLGAIGKTESKSTLNTLLKESEGKIQQSVAQSNGIKLNGKPLSSAVEKIRSANLKVGGDLGDDAAEVSALRDTIRKNFPELGKHLDDEHELVALKKVLSDARGTEMAAGAKNPLKGLDLSKPGTYLSPLTDIVENPAVASKISGASASLKVPQVPGAVGNVIEKTGGGLVTEPFRVSGNDQMPNMADQELTTQLQQMQQDPNAAAGATGEVTEKVGADGYVYASDGSIFSQDKQWKWDKAQNDWVQNTTPGTGRYSKENIMRAMEKDMQLTGGKNFTKLQALFEMANPEGKDGGYRSAGQEKEVSDIQNSINLMGSLDKYIDSNKDVLGPLKGRARGVNPYDTDAQAFNSQMKAVAQQVGKAMEGGVLRQEDTKKYEKMLPQISDTYDVAKQKLQGVKQMLEMQYESKKTFYESGGQTTIEDVTQDSLMPDMMYQ